MSFWKNLFGGGSGKPVSPPPPSQQSQQLLKASVEGNTDIVKTLIGAGADVNAKDKYGMTALTAAAAKSHTNCVEALIAAGAGIDARDETGATALSYAAWKGHIDCVKVLIAAGANVNAKNNVGTAALNVAAQWNHADCVEVLIAAGADVNAKDNYGMTALTWAASEGRTKCVEVLIVAGADVNAKGDDGLTALTRAASEGHTKCVEVLIVAGADVNAKGNDGLTALIAAAAKSHANCVKALIAAGSAVNARNERGKTALMYATEKGHADCVKVLMAAEADVNARSSEGRTALTPETQDAMVIVEAFSYTHEHILKGRLTGIYDDPMMYSERVLYGLKLAAEQLLPKEEVKRLFMDKPGISRHPLPPEKKLEVMLLALEGAISLVGLRPEAVPLLHLKVELENSQRTVAAPVAAQQAQTPATSTLTQPSCTSNSDYWKCPKCGGLLQKGVGAMFAETVGVATCGGCGAKFSQSDVYGGKYDVEERTVDPVHKFRIVGSTAFWGDAHQATFNSEYTSVELKWLLDGSLFSVSPTMTKAECRELVEESFPAAFQVALRSSQQFNLPRPEESNGYTLAIIKLHLSYAVRNNVALHEAQRIYKITMGS